MNKTEQSKYRLQQYKTLAPHHTLKELMSILGVSKGQILNYKRKTNIDYKPNPTFTRRSVIQWVSKFNEMYDSEMIASNPLKVNNEKGYQIIMCDILCLKCNMTYRANILPKIRKRTKCMYCDKGRHGNHYTHDEVECKLNEFHKDHWSLITYGDYSQKNSVIKCNICCNNQIVNLSNFINTTTRRCTICETGSFGEYIIKTTLLFNNVQFQQEFTILKNGTRTRLDFLITHPETKSLIGIEYSGKQHFEEGCYFNERINENVKHKAQWLHDNGHQFHEITATYDVDEIISTLSEKLNYKLKRPTSEFISRIPNLKSTLDYMLTHSARRTMLDLGLSRDKLNLFVKIAGYQSVSDFQKSNNFDPRKRSKS